MERKGIVLKIKNHLDKRSSYLEIDKSFNPLVDKIKTISDELAVDIFSVYTKEESYQLMQMIHLLIEKTEE